MARVELILKAMAEPTRQRLLQLLAGHELTVSEMVEILDQPQSTVSRHLKVLRESGLLRDRRFGNMVRYAALPPNPLMPTASNGLQTVGPNVHKESVRVSALWDRLLDWIGQNPLEDETKRRLEIVLRKRQADGDFFDTVGSRWDLFRIEAFGQAFHLEALTALLPSDWVVADIGTGTGYLLGALASRFRKVIAVDPAEGMLAVARDRPEVKTATNIEFRLGSLAELPLADGEADLAIASLVLHHVERPADALAELKRCLRPAGRLLIIEQETHSHAEFHERMGDLWWGFEPAMLETQVAAAGFAEVVTRRLASAKPANGPADDVPALFVLTASKQ
jgi:ArsR family transcriptional regulator